MSVISRLRLHELHYNLGYVLHQQGDLLGAAQNYRQTIALTPDYATAHHNLAVVLDAQGLQTEAIAHYTQAIALQPSARAYNNLGCALTKQGQLSEAIAAYQQAIALQPNWSTPFDNLGQVLVQRSPTEAIAAFRQAIEFQPNFVSAHYHLGKTLQRVGQHEAALTEFEIVLNLEPQHWAQADCATSLLALGRTQAALGYLRKAIAPQHYILDAYSQWATQLPPIDERSHGRAACGRFLQALQHDAPEALTHLAQTYLHLGNVLLAYGGDGQYRQAEIYYQQALQLQPQNGVLSLKLADALVHQGRMNAAIMVYHSLLARPGVYAPYAELGAVLEQQQDLQGAIAYYRRALQAGKSPLAAAPEVIGECEQEQKRVFKVYANATVKIEPLQGLYHSTWDWFQSTQAGQYVKLSAVPQPLPKCEAIAAVRPADCQGLNCSSCLKQITRDFQPVHLGDGIYAVSQQAVFPMERSQGHPSLPLFTATVPQGKAWAVPQQNDWMVCNALAVLTAENDLLADVSRDYPGQLPGCKHPDPNYHRVVNQPQVPPLEMIEGKVAVLSGLSGHNYFHWMVDVLPRLELLRRGQHWDEVDWFWINDNDRPFQRETLALLGVPEEKILSSDRHPYIQATELVVPSFAGHLGWVEPWALDFLRRSFLHIADLPADDSRLERSPERIYIRRDDAHHRRILNEEQVIAQLEAVGFVAVTLEALSFAEQVRLFAQAQVIIAPHGGGLTNTIFCQRGAIVVEFMAPQYIRHYYWVVSQALGLEHYFVQGETLRCDAVRQLMYPNPLTEDIWIQTEVLAKVLRRIGLGGKDSDDDNAVMRSLRAWIRE
jgi:tetratricopeptide (TPR) repeat protein/capsular polysaccharide biosynthesis protein